MNNRTTSTTLRGISMIEMLVVIFIIGATLASLLGLASFSLGVSTLIEQTTQANMIAQETMEAVRNFRDETIWETDGLGTLTVGTAYHPEKTADIPPKWILVEGEQTLADGFTRKIILETVYRDAEDNIAETGTEDPNTKKVTITVSWQERGRSHQVELVTYLTNWKE